MHGTEFKALLEVKEKARIEAREKDFLQDKLQVRRAVIEAEEVKRKEEEKKLQLKAQQSAHVEISKKLRMA